MQTFSFSRLLLLIKKWWHENTLSFLLGLAGLMGLHILAGWYWLSLNHGTSQTSLQLFLTISLLFVQTQRVSNSFKALHKPTTSAQWLLLPATHAEKFFAEFFWQTIIFMLLGIGLTMLTEAIFVQIAESRFLSNPVEYTFYNAATGESIFSSKYFDFDNNFSKLIWTFWLAAQFLYYWGAIRFKRGVYISIGLIIIPFVYLFGYYVKFINTIFFQKNSDWDGGWNLKVPVNNGKVLLYGPNPQLLTALNVAFIAICIFLLINACISLISEKTVRK